MHKTALEALENISITCDEVGMKPTIPLTELQQTIFDKHFADAFNEEFMIIKDALRRLVAYEDEEKMNKMWQEQLKFKEENKLNVPNQFELLSLSFYTAIEDKDKNKVFTVIHNVIEEATSLEGCYHYIGSYSPYEEPEFDYDDAEEVERVKLLIKLAWNTYNSVITLKNDLSLELTKESNAELKKFAEDIFYEVVHEIENKIVISTLTEYIEGYDV